MTREKALMLALKIVDVCKTYNGQDRCRQCPFNVNGCFVTDGNNVPSAWRAAELIEKISGKGNT